MHQQHRNREKQRKVEKKTEKLTGILLPCSLAFVSTDFTLFLSAVTASAVSVTMRPEVKPNIAHTFCVLPKSTAYKHNIHHTSTSGIGNLNAFY